MRFHEISGAKARRWRKNVAESAAQRDRTMRTLKFPLELGDGIDADRVFDAAQRLFRVTDGVGKGSLLGLLTAVHLSGFRVFSSGKETLLFRAFRKVDQDRFKDAFRAAFGCEPKNFVPAEIVNMLLTVPRGGKPFNRANLIDRLYPLVTSKGVARDKKPNTALVTFLGDFADGVLRFCHGWEDLPARIAEVLAVFDQAAAATGLPPLHGYVRDLGRLTPASTTIDLDPALPWEALADDDPAALHKVVAQKLRLAASQGVEGDASFVKQEVTSRQHNALSWLFGTGLRYWQDTAAEAILEDYRLDSGFLPRIQALKQWFLAIPRDPLFACDEANYNHTRKLLAGKVDSWVSNYLKRLREIDEAVTALDAAFVLPDVLDGPECSEALEGLGFGLDDLREALGGMEGFRSRARVSLERLLGRADRLPAEADIVAVEEFNEYLGDVSGMLSMLVERLRRKHDEEKALSDDVYARAKFDLPAAFKGFSRLNRISGGPVDVDGELERARGRFNALFAMMHDFAGEVLDRAAAAGGLADPVAARAEAEASRGERAGRPIPGARGLAVRWVWARITGLALTGSPALEDAVRRAFEEAGLLSRKNLNKLLVNRQGAIYKSPFSTRRHQPYELLSDADPMAALERILADVQAQAAAGGSPEILGDLVRARNLHHGLRLSGLPDRVALDPVWRERVMAALPVPAALKGQLAGEWVKREAVIRLFNLFQSELKGLQNMLLRPEFMLRIRFSRVGWDEFLYVPKARKWTPPGHVLAGETPVAVALRHLCAGTEAVELDGAEALKALSGSRLASNTRGGTPFASYLRQAPHDWYVNLKLAGLSGEVRGIAVTKTGLGQLRSHVGSPFRLRGPSSYKGLFDEALTDASQEIKEYTVLFERVFRQRAFLDQGGLRVEVAPERLEAFVSVPFEDVEKEEAAFPLTKTIIGIDLGEIGIGYAVFSASDFSLVESGTVRIRSIRNLMRKVQRFRGQRQPKQRFRQLASNQLALLRENATGDVLHHIDSLCARFEGFPVLESSVRNLASGSKQLLLVYDKVVNAYAYSDIDAHKTARLHHWFGAHRWTHPALEEVNQETGEVKPLNLFPGSVVHPAGTSQVCSTCGRNPYWDVSERYGKGGRRGIAVGDDGGIEVATGRILLKEQYGEDTGYGERRAISRTHKRMKQAAPISTPVAAKSLSPDKVVEILRNQLRQRNPSTRARDTMQSVYHCPYADCGHVMHADENAALNIVRKWLRLKLGQKEAWRYEPPAKAKEPVARRGRRS
jgi:hypothetical protein